MDSTAARPILRGFLKQQTKKNVVVMCAIAVVNVVLFKTFYVNRRQKRLAEYYGDLDAEKDYIMMREAGVFRSAPPRGKIDE